MTPLLEQFLSETRDVLQGIGEKLMELESAPTDPELMTALFRMVHTLKGNSGLFDLPELTRVLHAAEDLMVGVREGRVAFSQELTDVLLDAMDFVGRLCDEIDAADGLLATQSVHGERSLALVADLRRLLPTPAGDPSTVDGGQSAARSRSTARSPAMADVPAAMLDQARARAATGETVHFVDYQPAEDCFFQGTDPFLQARRTPDLLWGGITPRRPWAPLAALDAYRCALDFHMLTVAPRAALDQHYRYSPDEVGITDVSAQLLAPVAATTTGPSSAAAETIPLLLAIQRTILELPLEESWHVGRMKAAAAALAGCVTASGDRGALAALELATAAALAARTTAPLLAWLDARDLTALSLPPAPAQEDPARALVELPVADSPEPATTDGEGQPKTGRRTEEAIAGAKSLKVDQAKIDRLMSLIGEMVVSKNALPYLAGRAETVFGVRELAREIKAQYAVINRIAQQMQDAIMQVRMMPVSFVFQRFPRLVRDLARKLGKEVELVLEGEDTEADKNIIEALADPLMHIVRNSLDHGFELPNVRRAGGKPAIGTLTIRASQQADRVSIEISDDGKGIDPAVIKLKAYEKGLIDEATLERIADQDAINLVFAPGFSTAEAVSELSGRGVGMDVVRSAVERVNGSVTLRSETGQGTHISISLPLSMAVTNVMIVEADGQKFGMPMDSVVETVRVPKAEIHQIKNRLSVVLRGRIVPLKSINSVLGLGVEPKANGDDETAVLVVRVGNESVGLLVDDFRETAEIILKPLTGVLAGLAAYSGSALMGDGSVLMVLNAKEMM